MDYRELISDFGKRTRANLDYIRAQVQHIPDDQREVYEVTQLANSLLGLLVFPHARYMNLIPKTSLDDLVHQGWPRITVIEGTLREDNLRELIRVLRNGIAHCNIEFTSNSQRSITGLRIWNERNQKITWKAELSLDDLDAIVAKFIQLIIEPQDKRSIT